MTWNYRIMKDRLGIHTFREVYYDEAGNIEGWTANGVTVQGDDVNELLSDFAFFSKAIEKPVLDEVSLENQILRKDCSLEASLAASGSFAEEHVDDEKDKEANSGEYGSNVKDSAYYIG